MPELLEEVYNYIDEQQDRSIQDLRTFLRQPSISAQELGLVECADLLGDLMREAGIDTQVYPVSGAGPIVVGQVRYPEATKTLVCYGHYDVQPPDPVELWTTDPFAADLRAGRIFARGATDDKGSLFESVKAVQALLETQGRLPVNMVMVFEGEEEIGSGHFGSWVAEHRDLFEDADGVYGLDGNCDPFTGYPRMYLWGTGGILYVELRVQTAEHDTHAGEAAWVPNAAWRLTWALGTLKDERERILIDGWYEDYVQAPQEEIEFFEQLPFDENQVKEYCGVEELLLGRSGGEVYRARYYEPTCTIAGFRSGYGGKGMKTVVPCEATAKIDFRLRRNQEPQKQLELLKAYLARQGFGDIEVIPLAARPSAALPPTYRKADVSVAMQRAAERFFGVRPIIWGGATEPVEGPSLVERYGLAILGDTGNGALQALGIPDARGWMGDLHSNIHAADEFISVKAFVRGQKIAATIIQEFAGA
ncbi:MAG: M20/M25/M40 family metallo-hydrolase [bacterium]